MNGHPEIESSTNDHREYLNLNMNAYYKTNPSNAFVNSDNSNKANENFTQAASYLTEHPINYPSEPFQFLLDAIAQKTLRDAQLLLNHSQNNQNPTRSLGNQQTYIQSRELMDHTRQQCMHHIPSPIEADQAYFEYTYLNEDTQACPVPFHPYTKPHPYQRLYIQHPPQPHHQPSQPFQPIPATQPEKKHPSNLNYGKQQLTSQGVDDQYFTQETLVKRPKDINRRKHQCEVCLKSFTRPSTLKVHLNSHTGAKPHVCPGKHCEWKFSVSSNLNRHVALCPHVNAANASKSPLRNLPSQ